MLTHLPERFLQNGLFQTYRPTEMMLLVTVHREPDCSWFLLDFVLFYVGSSTVNSNQSTSLVTLVSRKEWAFITVIWLLLSYSIIMLAWTVQKLILQTMPLNRATEGNGLWVMVFGIQVKLMLDDVRARNLTNWNSESKVENSRLSHFGGQMK